MIHNIAEERKKQNRRETSLSEPYSDEELMRLISQVEESALIHAPGRLKDEIFFQLSAEREMRKKRQLFYYRVEVLVGMAAALAVLFLTPVGGARTAETGRGSMLGSLLAGKETEEMETWEQEVLDRQREIDRTWERYRKQQERADARKRYFENMANELTGYENWED